MATSALSSLVSFLQEKEFLTNEQLGQLTQQAQFQEATSLLREVVRRGWLTSFQANQLAQGNGNDLVLGPYRIIEPIGEGGMGKVFKARHVRMHRIVALKIIPEEMLSNPQTVARFDREVRAVAQLSHPNIVTAYEVNEDGRTHYFAMEFMEGIDLGKLVRQSGPLPIAQACDYIRQAALGLQHAHEKGLVHRDIKPGNLIVGRTTAGGDPVVKILDFGLARFETHNQQVTRLTKIGHVLGTVDYVSPEQAGNAREVDIRADIYSLGCSLFYLLTGKPPFEGADSMERTLARLVKEAPPLRTLRAEVPAELEKIVAKMLVRNPAERYATPAEVAAALEPFARPPTAQPNPVATAAQPSRNISSKPKVVIWNSSAESAISKRAKLWRKALKAYPAVGIGLLVAILVGLGFLIGRKSQESATPAQAVAENPADVKQLAPPKAPPAEVPEPNQPALKAPEPKPAPQLPEPNQPVDLPQNFTNSLGMEFVLVPKGKSWLAGGSGKPGQTEVEIKEHFYLGKYEITQEEWEKTMGVNPSYFGAVLGVAEEDQKRFPVENLSWEDAQIFIKLLNEKSGKAGWLYRLPSEVEWEYACRGGPMKSPTDSAFDYYFEQGTNQLVPDVANFQHPTTLKRTCKVGSYKPNRLGLYDMHGNVWEWCQNAILNSKGLAGHVERGGSWANVPTDCRAVSRHLDAARDYFTGLRLACVPVDKPAAVLLPPEVKKPSVKPAKSFANSIGMELVYIPSGKFTMGSPKYEEGRAGSEGPAREVEITRGFYMGKFEVTQAQYRTVMGENPSWFYAEGGGKNLVTNMDTDEFPVEQISWHDAVEFCRKLSEQEKKQYGLPTEAEWEYACRAGTRTAYSFGDTISQQKSNYAKVLNRTTKVGSYPANDWGLYDMHGNVWEWCKDWYKKDYYAQGPPRDPLGPASGAGCVLRGGSFGGVARVCRSAFRTVLGPPGNRSYEIGFRVVLRSP